MIWPQERRVSSADCFRVRKGQNSEGKDEMFSPVSLNTARHSFISVMYNLKLSRETNSSKASSKFFPTMKSIVVHFEAFEKYISNGYPESTIK